MQVRKGKVHDARSFGGRIQGRIVRALALQILQSGCRREDLAKVLVPDKAIKIANGGGIFRRHAFWQTLGIDQGGGRRERRNTRHLRRMWLMETRKGSRRKWWRGRQTRSAIIPSLSRRGQRILGDHLEGWTWAGGPTRRLDLNSLTGLFDGL